MYYISSRGRGGGALVEKNRKYFEEQGTPPRVWDIQILFIRSFGPVINYLCFKVHYKPCHIKAAIHCQALLQASLQALCQAAWSNAWRMIFGPTHYKKCLTLCLTQASKCLMLCLTQASSTASSIFCSVWGQKPSFKHCFKRLEAMLEVMLEAMLDSVWQP